MNNVTPPPEILSAMIGTAGHVDHGKSSLVRNLTGFDTDRLQEEKERGLSIDIAVAPWRLSDGRLTGIIDVPGHMDFIRNMVAGASSIDVLMLVVAADDGIMPQTREHLEIVRTLRTPVVIAVLTKADRVDKETIGPVRGEVSGLLKAYGFPNVPIIAVSNLTGEGLDDLRTALEKIVSGLKQTYDDRAFRMSIRQGFSMKGYGTVLTGVPVSGTIETGLALEILPPGIKTTLRSVQNYRQKVDRARGGVSTGLNLRDIVPGDVRRGMVVAVPGIYKPTTSAIIFFRSASHNIKLNTAKDLKFYSGTSAVQVSLKTIDKRELHQGEGCFMQVRFREPLVLAAGDRFILRSQSTSVTLGGGVLLSAREYSHRRKDPFLFKRLKMACEAVEKRDYFLSEILAGPAPALNSHELLRLTQHLPQDAGKLVAEKEDAGWIKGIGDGWIVMARIDEVLLTLKTHLQRYHDTNKSKWGMEAALVWHLLGLEAGDLTSLLKLPGAERDFEIREGCLALRCVDLPMNAGLITLRQRIQELLIKYGPNWISKDDLVNGLGIARADLRILIKTLQEEGFIMAIGNYYILSRFISHCREDLIRLFDHSPEVDISMFRRVTGLSRALAITILESFDTEGLTRRIGDKRILLRQEKSVCAGGE